MIPFWCQGEITETPETCDKERATMFKCIVSHLESDKVDIKKSLDKYLYKFMSVASFEGNCIYVE